MTAHIAVTEDLASCHLLRRIVFIEEQNVSEADEMDDRDDDATHFLATEEELPIGSARMHIKGDTAKIGRSLTTPALITARWCCRFEPHAGHHGERAAAGAGQDAAWP